MIDLQKYLPLDKWVYLKIYTGYRTADRILSEVLYPAWIALSDQKAATRWFFVRYSDPDFHLRFRVEMSDQPDAEKITNRLIDKLKPYTDTGLVWNVDICSYFPEIERYGKQTMECADDIFWADSEAVIAILQAAETMTVSRWQFALVSIDNFLDDFKYELAEKKELLLQLSRNFGKEFGKNKDLARQLSTRFREKRITISRSLGKENLILSNRSVRVREPIDKILSCYEDGSMELDKNDLLSSIIHMSMNRIFQSRNRLYEMVIYDFLFRYYKSRLMMK